MTVAMGTSGGAQSPDDDLPPIKAKRGASKGSMTLTGHLYELRSRLFKSAIAFFLGATIGWIYYDQIFAFLSAPVEQVVQQARLNGQNVQLTITDITGAFTLQLQVAALTGLILASPVWIYQLWRFITPGLHKHERRYAVAFAAVAVPLFLFGVVLAYVFLPGALGVLFSFTPENVANFQPVDSYLAFFTRMVIVFGVGFLTPLILVALNMFGVLTGKKLASWWRFIIFGVFIFAAVATPTADPFNLCLLAVPVLVLVGAALIFCFLNDRRRARKHSADPEYSQWADDETSPL